MKGIVRVIFVLGFFTLISAATCHAIIIEKIVAVVNGKPIMLSEVQERQIVIKVTTGQELTLQEVLKKMVIEEVVMQEAEKLGLVAEDEVVNEYIENLLRENHITLDEFKKLLHEKGITFEAYKEEIRRRITTTRVMNTQIRMRIAVAEEEIKEYYEKHKSELHGSYDEVKEKIRNLIMSERIEERYKKWIEELMNKSTIKIML
ncbi:MAG: SurA N-terminal domain-containing protein [Thermosulfidibacteraceae bacterium]|jgi:peptidyl-prolyl cis-trans isomerase SurA